ncbi:deoxyuridine 5'-triphosphate nucleotidohydrolase [Atractiella rhizophila]|nr:deoxyuridine 5'-triphosphate nucleotidohydrolase [Atractiella rhizophila]
MSEKRPLSPSAPAPPTKRVSLSTPLQIKRLTPTATVPTRGSAFAAGYDIYADEDVEIAAGARHLVKTGMAIAVPSGCYGRVAPRSGLAVKHGITTGAGVVDEDYRGEVRVLLFNLATESFSIKRGDRIAQLVLERIYTPEVVEVQELSETVRGEGGFGSTGGFGMVGAVPVEVETKP